MPCELPTDQQGVANFRLGTPRCCRVCANTCRYAVGHHVVQQPWVHDIGVIESSGVRTDMHVHRCVHGFKYDRVAHDLMQ